MATKTDLDPEQIENLLEDAKSGDTISFGILFDQLFDEIYRFAFLKVGNKETAQDIASETFTGYTPIFSLIFFISQAFFLRSEIGGFSAS